MGSQHEFQMDINPIYIFIPSLKYLLFELFRHQENRLILNLILDETLLKDL
jgi:hypothetical protein